ncbi:oxidoreductase [Actinocrispum wychmicini]|uniref:NAD(P)-dependent dehydrogenase (Short-subunit alcohol dehydrogenase family) n=1 Tax=Actinocrispum wychmicini TaxID=1213861 RepID=A0A4R2JLT3_9PSEU|nr:oxidoreductase [Actinocrispum wychmicini]TCO61033.1 NAD(P)-dependent dehydrogenase (short-subunit alcohol dehydrogenase family) [Actinocrispum wychmicini]
MSTKWTAADIPDQTGRVAVVTGANSGLGLVTARELARAGAEVVLACRDPKRGADAAAAVRAVAPAGKITPQRLDLASLVSVREFAELIGKEYDGLDLLVNNAGVMALPRRETVDGFEAQFGTNHLGHFALTGRLFEMLAARPNSRVVTVSSGLHRMGRIDFDDLQGAHGYRKWGAYGQSKLANLLFAFELDRRSDSVRSYAAHPGYAATNLQSTSAKASGRTLDRLVMTVGNALFAQPQDMGALPSLYAATYPDLPGASFVGPKGLFEQRGHPGVVHAAKPAYDQDVARRLWEVSEELTDVRFPVPSSTS